jgi:hypothetical protein
MEFCSKYGFDYGFQGSDEETIEDTDQVTKLKVNKKVRKIDSNIIACTFDRLLLSNNMFAGDQIACKKCTAIVTSLSKKNVKTNENKFLWICDFCYQENELSDKIKSLDELPNEDDVTFLLEPTPAEPTTATAEASNPGDDSYLTFCIDVSGSMDEKIQIKKNNEAINKYENPDSLFYYEQSDMSRLDGVKLACIETLKSIKDDNPNKLVSMVTFSNDVKFFGDCRSIRPIIDTGNRGSYNDYNTYNRPLISTQQTSGIFQKLKYFARGSSSSQTQFSQVQDDSDIEQIPTTLQAPARPVQEIGSGILDNKEKIIALAKNQDGKLKPISNSYPNLEHKLKSLRTEGSTALGPALAFSIGFSTKKKGSQVCICTDGCANVGMGTIEYGDINKAEEFYSQIADYAKKNGVSVNVISMEGTDCKLSLLGKLADKTNGTLKIVNPLNLSEEFKSILENRIVATNVTAKLIVNEKYLYIRDEELEAEIGKAIDENDMKKKEEINLKKKSIQEKEIGNATIETEITFEYGIKKLGSKASKNDEFKELPFQLQITYTGLDGSRAMRVYTKIQKFTKDRNEAESNILSKDLVFSNAAQKISHLTLTNNVASAQYRSKAMANLYFHNNAPISYLNKAKLVEGFDKNLRYDQMDDFASEEMYSGKKVNRKFKK